jgi:pantoate--beta-alanine ligase
MAACRLASGAPRGHGCAIGLGEAAMRVIRDLETLRDATAGLRAGGLCLGLVPTMGALHRGHLALVEEARRHAGAVAVSIFVNPLQFGPNEDLARYPRDEAGDLEKLRGAGCDLVWMPPVEAMYPPGAATVIEVGGPSEGFEGAARPGHFRGVATVCTKLFNQTGADVAVFGEKDWQQLQVVRRVVADLDMRLRIIGHPTVREADELAFSSRNQRLSPGQRALAPLLPRCMKEAIAAMADGAAPDAVLAEATARLRAAGFKPDYLALVEPATLRPWPPGATGEARLLAAAGLGDVRLLDNMPALLPGR